MTQERIGIGYSDEEWHPVVRRCRQALHQDPEPFGESFGAKPSGPALPHLLPVNWEHINLTGD
jgi:hypothetical protein